MFLFFVIKDVNIKTEIGKGGDKMTKAEVNLLKKYIKACGKLKTFPENNKNTNKNYIEIKEKERLLG